MRPSQVGILTPESLRPTNGSGSAFRAVSHFQALWLALCASAQTPAYPPSWRCAGAGGGGWGPGWALFSLAPSPLTALGRQCEPHRMRPGAHRLPGQSPGRPRRSAGQCRCPDPRPFLPVPAPLRAGLPRSGAGPRGGDRGGCQAGLRGRGRGGTRVLAPSPSQLPLPHLRRSSSPRCAPRSQPCATSPPSASCPWCGCASLTPAAAAMSPPCTAQYSVTSPPRVRKVLRRSLERAN